MKRLILTMMALGIPAVASAQLPDARTTTEGIVVAAPTAAAAAGAAVVQSGGSVSSGPRRRPSMVGYIENADIGNKLRVRFDSGKGIQSADRAEFFYAKCGCYRFLAPNDPAYDPDAPGPGPGVLTSADYTQFNVYGEYALSGRFSLVADLPIRSLKPKAFVPGTGTFPDASGLSDVRAGLKLGMASDGNSQITLQALVSAPTGDSMKGLGTNHWSVEPAVLYATQLSDLVGLEAEFGSVIPIDGSRGPLATSGNKFAGKVIYYGVGPSVDIYSNGRTRLAPVVELVGWHVIDGYSTFDNAPANGTNIVNLKVGGRLAVGANSVYLGWGKGLTNAKWYDELIRFEYRYGF
jgi:hypothetical protein